MNRLRKTTHASLGRRLTGLAGPRRDARGRGEPSPAPVLARAFSHPQGAGVIGPGSQRLLRAVLVDTLTRHTEGCDVVISLPDLEHLLGAASTRLPSRFASALHITNTLEDAIEHLESRSPRVSTTGVVEQTPILWLATPGSDADVVYQTLDAQPATDLIPLFNGPWPYGPTHFIDIDGPRRLPDHDLTLLTRDQAIARLRSPGSPH